MAFHWAGNMSPLGRAGAPALRAESAAPFAEGSMACCITARLCQIPQTPLKRSLEQGRAFRRAGPRNGPWTDPDALLLLMFGVGSRTETAC